MKCIFLYNPNSGKGKIKNRLSFIERTLKTRYDEVVLYATKSAEDMQKKASESAEVYDAVIFSGGDGSFHLVLGGVGEKKATLGYLPSGTANDVARSLGIPKNPKKALKIITDGRSEKVDCMRINKTGYAMYIAAAGAFTSVTYSTPQKKKKRLGWLAYALQCLKKNMKFNSFPIEVICGEERCRERAVLILIMNGRSVAGFPVNKEASMRDGRMEIAILREREALDFWGRVRAFFQIVHLFLHGCKNTNRHLLRLSGDRISIYADESVVWDLDGERGDAGNIEAELLAKHVNLFVPKNKKI